MRMRNTREIKIGLLLQTFLAILVLSSGCRKAVRGPLSIDEVLKANVCLPIHHLEINPNTSCQELDTTYYYFGNPPELRLDTYFTIETSEGETVRVARMSTFNLNGQVVNIDETKGNPTTLITWAKDGGGVCKIFSDAYRNDRITGDSFQSCLYWLDQDLNQYKFYSVWPEKEAVDFVNSLSVLEK
ncbi:MAG: hypothetical protein GY832_08235 [Chloroflexi bacterium]|nr:hypothetical protein [Chloroflexota bacterium]